jgi:hypothetical protein
MTDYLIWSHEHGQWWRAGGFGHTRLVTEAGRFSRVQALRYCVHALRGRRFNPEFPELPVRAEDIDFLLHFEDRD